MDGFTARTFAALAHSLDLNEIVVIGGEAELRSGFVGQDNVDVVVAMSLQHHLRPERKKKTVILDSEDKSELCSKLGPTKYPVTFDSVSMATTGSQCSVSKEPIMVHCILRGARSGAKKKKKEPDIKIYCGVGHFLCMLEHVCVVIYYRFTHWPCLGWFWWRKKKIILVWIINCGCSRAPHSILSLRWVNSSVAPQAQCTAT